MGLIIHTDGACSGNPGPMGIGGIIQENGLTLETFSESMGRGTNNEAEYLAIIRALELAIKYQPESVVMKSDSQLAVYQIQGEYGINHEHLARLCGKVQKLTKQFPGSVRFVWVPRESNKVADAFASKAVGTPQAVIINNQVIQWQPDPKFVPNNDLTNALPEPKPACASGISKLKKMRNPKFKDFLVIKSDGLDKYSRLSVDKLTEIVGVRFGGSSVVWLEEVVGVFESDYGKKVLKWVARGLPPDLALKKVSVDMEVAANAGKKKFSRIK